MEPQADTPGSTRCVSLVVPNSSRMRANLWYKLRYVCTLKWSVRMGGEVLGDDRCKWPFSVVIKGCPVLGKSVQMWSVIRRGGRLSWCSCDWDLYSLHAGGLVMQTGYAVEHSSSPLENSMNGMGQRVRGPKTYMHLSVHARSSSLRLLRRRRWWIRGRWQW